MAVIGTWFSQNLASVDLCSLNTTKQSTDVITSLSLIEEFTEHLDTSYNSFLGLFFQTCDFNFLIQMKNTSLNTASSNSTTTSDGEYVLYRHDEVFISVTLRIRDPAIYCIHKLHDFISPWASRIFQSFQSRTLDDRSVISREGIIVQQLTDRDQPRANVIERDGLQLGAAGERCAEGPPARLDRFAADCLSPLHISEPTRPY